MKITLIASTKIENMPNEIRNTRFFNDKGVYEGTPADILAHFAGRACYQSWDMPNEATRSNEGYIANIIKQGHFSILEHASATFYVEGVSRNLTHELVRHRHLSYSELSQRFVDMKDANFIVPPAVMEHFDEDDAPENGMQAVSEMEEAYEAYRAVVDNLTALGYSRKRAREAARFYLPSGVETKIVVTGNMRAWRDMLHKRYSVHADAEIQKFSSLILKELKQIAPAGFQDFPETPFE